MRLLLLLQRASLENIVTKDKTCAFSLFYQNWKRCSIFQAADYGIDLLRLVAYRENNLLPAIQYSHEFNRSELKLDFCSLSYLDFKRDQISQDLQPVLSTCDGNCLFNALSIALCGTEYLSAEIKVRTCIEMASARNYYVNQQFSKEFLLCSPTFDEATVVCAKKNGFQSAWAIQAASDALCRDISVIYPKVNGLNDHQAKLLKRIHSTKHKSACKEPLKLMWTKIGPQIGKLWIPNHFVPLVSVQLNPDELLNRNVNEKMSTPSRCMNTSRLECLEMDVDASCIKNTDLSLESECEERSELESLPSRNYASDEEVDNLVPNDTEARWHTDEIFTHELPSSEIDKNETDNSGSDTSKGTEHNKMHPLPGRRYMEPLDIINILQSEIPAEEKIPLGVKENVFIVLNNSKNMDRMKCNKPPQYWDDCGAWDSKKSKSATTNFLLRKSNTTPYQLVHVKVIDQCIYQEYREKGLKKTDLWILSLLCQK